MSFFELKVGKKVIIQSGGASAASNSMIIFGFFLAATASFEILSGFDGLIGWSRPIAVWGFLWVTVFLICSFFHFKTAYLFGVAYITCLIAFHLSLIFKHGTGIEFSGKWSSSNSFSSYLEAAGWYTLLALACFSIGYGFSSWARKIFFISKERALPYMKKSKVNGLWYSLGLLLASGLFFILAIASYGNLLSYARHEIFQSNADSRGFGVFMMVFPGAVWLYLLSARTPKHYFIGFSLVIFSFLLFMLSGYRSAALFSSLIGVICWVKSGRKLPIWVTILGVIFVLLAISFVGILRTLGAYSDLGAEELKESAKNTNMSQSVNTMGQSVGILAHTIKLVPTTDPHRWGRSYYFALIDSIPNIGLKIDASYSRQKLKQEVMKNPNAINKMVPSDWMTYRILREQFDLGQGVGFSTIAEAYLNFGYAGVVLFFLILGYLIGRLDHINILMYPKIFIFVSAMMWPLARTVRNDFSNFIKPAMFMLIIFFIWWLISKYFLGKFKE